MKIYELNSTLNQHPGLGVRFVLPDGDLIPAEFHVTEVGHVAKNFIDCGGTTRSVNACLLQTWVSEDDKDHRLTAGKLAKIMDLARKLLPSDQLDVEVEYDCCVVAQYTVDSFKVEGSELRFVLGNKKTDCLAREACGVGTEQSGCGCGTTASKCC